ncbi:MAG TPA: hypothetical protein VKP30_32735, partial [Polyangiaceae bacterium]|nr:hypothetical protein [Polyangiaceae bacterium]
DALCPALKQTTEAVHARLGTLKSAQPGWRARYTVGHAPGSGQGDFVRLELFDPDQRLKLVRELPVGHASCSTLAQSIAIVLSGYFQSLAPADDGELPTPPVGLELAADPDASVVSLQETKSTVPPDRVPKPKQPNPPPIATWRGSEGVPNPVVGSDESRSRSSEHQHTFGVGFAMPFAVYGRGLTISYAASPGQYTQYGALLTLPLERTSVSVDDGRVSMWSARARVWYGARVAISRLVSVIGPTVSLGLDSAYARGLAEPQRQQRAVVALGLLLDATFWVYASLGLGLQAGMDVGEQLGSRRFVVQGSRTEPELEVHRPRWVNGFAGASLKVSLPN